MLKTRHLLMATVASLGLVVSSTRADLIVAAKPVTGSPEALWTTPIAGGTLDIVYQHLDACFSVVFHDGRTYVAYETSDGSRKVKVAKIDPDGGVERSDVGKISSGSFSYPAVHSLDGHLWVEWLSSESDLAYREGSGGTWENVSYESCGDPCDIEAARERIRQMILNGE